MAGMLISSSAGMVENDKSFRTDAFCRDQQAYGGKTGGAQEYAHRKRSVILTAWLKKPMENPTITEIAPMDNSFDNINSYVFTGETAIAVQHPLAFSKSTIAPIK
jgi:hypothetical protein